MSEVPGSAARRPFMTAGEVDALASRPPDATLAYGHDPAQVGDLRLAEGGGPHPVAVVIHGGCWLAAYASRRNTAAQADALRGAGVTTWNIEYRGSDQPGGGWPGTFLDVAAAIDHLRHLASTYRLDLRRVVTVGHSAGGHLALWAATRHRLPPTSPLYTAEPLQLAGVVVLGGPGDLGRFRPLAHAAAGCGGPVVERLLGGLPSAVPERYRAASPIEHLPLGLPQIFITGEHDYVIPPAEADHYVAQARRLGDPAHHHLIPDVAHHEYNDPTSTAWPTVRDALLSLTDQLIDH